MLSTIWFDRRVRSWGLQLLLLAAVIAGFGWLAWNAQANLARRGITSGFGFLDQAARFPISESLLAYDTSDTFGHAFLVGIVNTLFVSVLVILFSTVLGVLLALARRSRHPLVSGAAAVYLEVIRNTPLVVQLLFWYAMLTVALPPARQALSPLPGVFLSVRGLYFPKLVLSGNAAWFWVALAASLVLVVAAVMLRPMLKLRRGMRFPLVRAALVAALAAIALAAWIGDVGIALDVPRLRGLNFTGGTTYTPEFTALLVGLVFYSTAFSGEIIRGGIDAVPSGQWEAGEALGIRRRHLLRLVVFPQALRIILPPMTSQYLSIIKNSTLALAVGYPDLSFVVATTINQTGQAIEGILILMGVFLTISLTVSLLMNAYNRRLALVQR
jgi:general L-amino acid transport system permease protein